MLLGYMRVGSLYARYLYGNVEGKGWMLRAGSNVEGAVLSVVCALIDGCTLLGFE